MEIGKLPPQAIELEEAVLGAMLLEKEAIYTAIDIWKEDTCYKESNIRVFQAICHLHKSNKPVDILTVCEELKRNGYLEIVGGAFYVSNLTTRVASSANIEFHARIVAQKHLQREMIRISTRTITSAYEDSTDVFDLMDECTRNIDKLRDGIKTNKIDSIEDIKNAIIDNAIKINNSNMSSGINCSIDALNLHTGGWQKSTLTIIAARPGMGKTSFALDCALFPAKNNIPTAFFSFEMSKEQLIARALAMESGMHVQKITNNQLKNEDIQLLDREGAIFNGVPMFIDDTPEMNINEFKTRARRLKREKKIKLIVLDYIQLMKGVDKKSNRETEVSEISRGLKVLSRELEIPIIALSQLSRNCEDSKREYKKPQLSDLRESGAIEQDADNVIFLLRPEYYGYPTYTIGTKEYDSKNLFIFILAKFRNGGLGEIKSKWIGYLTKIINYPSEFENVDKNNTIQPF